MTRTHQRQEPEAPINEARLLGRVSGVPETRILPSGDVVVSFRVVVRRARPQRRVAVDTLECAAWTAGLRRTVSSWGPGDTVEVSGALRRRFFRSGGATVSRVEIEVTRAKRLTRAEAGAPAP